MNVLKSKLPLTAGSDRESSAARSAAFTLIELLVVISIIGVLAALTIPALNTVKRQQTLKTATAELSQIAMAIENYHARYGVYPPCNTNNFAFSQLYYELSGVTINAAGNYQTLDSSATITEADYLAWFHVGGIVNRTHGSGEDTTKAEGFLPSLPQNRVANVNGTNVLVTSVRGPDASYRPLGVDDVNPFRYNSANPTNNPTTYDLWIDLSIRGKTNRVSNWNRQAQIIQ